MALILSQAGKSIDDAIINPKLAEGANELASFSNLGQEFLLCFWNDVVSSGFLTISGSGSEAGCSILGRLAGFFYTV